MTGYVIETMRVTAEHTTLPLLLWRRFRKPMPGLVEDTLTRNPGLADLGEVLPVGTTFALKVETTGTQGAEAATLAPISLW